MTTQQWISILISFSAVVVSVICSLLIVAYKTGQITQRVIDLDREKANVSDVTAMKEILTGMGITLGKIEGMFVLRLRE